MVLRLTTCKNAFDAEVVKGALADMGIESILQGENMSQVYGGIGAMEVNVLVDEKDYDKARAFIDSREAEEYKPEEEQTPTKVDIKDVVRQSLLTAFLTTIVIGIYDYFTGQFENDSVSNNIISLLVFFVTLAISMGIVEYGIRKYRIKKK